MPRERQDYDTLSQSRARNAEFDNPRRALLILSHTNVARAEIERKAAAIPEAQRILRPPHFIGTIQAFVNRFLALPFLRSNGMHVQRVDNDSAAALHLRLISSNRYRTARFALAKRGDWDVADLEVGAEEGTIAFNGAPLSMSRDTPTYRELVSLKNEAIDAGMYRFGDMYAFAQRYVSAHTWVVPLLQQRFAIVFLDEVQDNDERQSTLLRTVFPRTGHVRVHRFGDSNQAIFGDAGSRAAASDFPEEPVLPLTESRRFGSFIAGVVSTVSANGQTVLGAGENPSRPHSILLYDQDAVELVVPKFAEIVASTLEPGESVAVFAIGARKTAPSAATDGTLRAHLASYFPSLEVGEESRVGEDCFAARIADARSNNPVEQLGMAVTTALQGFRQLLKLYPISEYEPEYRRLRSEPVRRHVLGKVILRLLRPNVVDEDLWNSATGNLIAVLRSLYGEPSVAASEYLKFRQCPGLASLGHLSNAFVLNAENGKRVAVQVKTIHAVKGETHRATLVLETFNRTHDVKKLIPYLCGAKRVTGKEDPADQQRLRTVYVALSRPQHLVCLALNAAHISEKEVDVLSSRWNIVRIAANAS